MRRAAARHGRAAALLAVGFALGTLAAGVASGELYRDARSKGVDVFSVTGRPDAVRAGGHAGRAFKLPNPMYFIP